MSSWSVSALTHGLPALTGHSSHRHQARLGNGHGRDCGRWFDRFWLPDQSSCCLGVRRAPAFGLGFHADAASPGMGLNAYFTYQVVGVHGTGDVPYRLALTAVFIEGFVFLFLSLVGLRQWLVKIIPASVKVASGVGIGLFLTSVGLSTSAGIGAITGAIGVPTQLGGCPAEHLNEHGACNSHTLQSPTASLTLLA